MNAIVVSDLTFGDAGKGSLVDYLTRRHNAHTVIRFNGGAQAAHNVVTPEGKHHTFSQFGSGTFVPGVRTHLSRFVLFDPVSLIGEERHLQSVGIRDGYARLTVDRHAPVVTPFQRAAGRLREMARGDGRHGSCGMGIGETMADLLAGLVVRAGDLLNRHVLRKKLREMQEAKRAAVVALDLRFAEGSSGGLAARELDLLRDAPAPDEFADLFEEVAGRITFVDSAADILRMPGNVIFEGAQGVLLDEWHGFHPHTTWSTATFANAMELLREARYAGCVTRVGAMRAYMTRHGTGPFPTEDAGLVPSVPEPHNRLNAWQREFRVGWLDLPLLTYALEAAGGADYLAVTHLDLLPAMARWLVCTGYDGVGAEFMAGDRLRVGRGRDLEYQARLANELSGCVPIYEEVGAREVLPLIAERLGPVGMGSFGPTWREKIVAEEASAMAA